ncbi:RNA polymerase II degradation factor 1-like [Sorghum bicolor]|uniref:RNA polymerase II degradation factor 1-like n=1 Tax=Sorghum bicolor TaxID=4558 RepID=UPI000B42409E|nr:RNA polymerase II degradation factor 1-like [Sorghum bicolor]|eukprot:XP_021309156.1 RNA polymerase II degradation factor 1-like [Sorghum bicolor]
MRPDAGSIDLGPIDVRSSRPPVKEGEVDRNKRRESAEKQKSALDLKKKNEKKKKNLERQALEARRSKSRQRGEPEEESPDEDDGSDGDDNSDDFEGMASRLDRILEGLPRAGADAPWTGAPKEGLSGSLEKQQRESSPHRSRADTPPAPVRGRLKRTLEQAQPSMAKRLKVGAASKDSGSSDPRPSTGIEGANAAMRVEAPRLPELEGAPEPPRSGVEADPIIISDGSGGDGPPRDARPMDEEVEASPIAKRTPWPIGLHSVEERRKKEEEEREQETRRQPQEEQQPQQKERGEGQPPAGPQLEELLEQDHQQELQELQEQQQQRGQQLEDLLKPRSHSPPQPVPPAPQEPGSGEESLPVYGPPTPAWLRPGALASIPAEPGRADEYTEYTHAYQYHEDKGEVYTAFQLVSNSFKLL